MTISELVQELLTLQTQIGDLPVISYLSKERGRHDELLLKSPEGTLLVNLDED